MAALCGAPEPWKQGFVEAALRHGRTDKRAMKRDHRACRRRRLGGERGGPLQDGRGGRQMVVVVVGGGGQGTLGLVGPAWDLRAFKSGSFRVLSPEKINSQTCSSCYAAFLITPREH